MIEEYTSKDIDHLGIIAVICNDIGLVEAIDTLIPSDPMSRDYFGGNSQAHGHQWIRFYFYAPVFGSAFLQ